MATVGKVVEQALEIARLRAELAAQTASAHEAQAALRVAHKELARLSDFTAEDYPGWYRERAEQAEATIDQVRKLIGEEA